MKVLWVSNSPIGPASQILGVQYQGSSGGWIQSEYEYLDKSNLQMFFLCSLSSIKKSVILKKKNEIGSVYCISSPTINYGLRPPKSFEKKIREIINEIKPDIIHIWGTETYISNIVSKHDNSIPKVLFIQGLLGVHKRYLGGYFSRKDNVRYFKGISYLGIFKQTIKNYLFARQSEIEKDTIIRSRNIIVDNDFSRAYCKSLNSEIMCYNRTLIPSLLFKSFRWELKNISKHTIFTVYGSSAEKGLHNLLHAVSIVKRKYNDVRVIIPGDYDLNKDGKINPNSKKTYQRVLLNMIDDLRLSSNVIFIGKQDTYGMASFLIKSHIFVNPSCMEVHALSLREALFVGIPSISSLSGSVCELISHGQNGFVYRYEEYETLAYYIEKLFNDIPLSENFSINGSNHLNQSFLTSETLNDIYLNSIKAWNNF
jgi:L-malate glycosyltransferase